MWSCPWPSCCEVRVHTLAGAYSPLHLNLILKYGFGLKGSSEYYLSLIAFSFSANRKTAEFISFPFTEEKIPCLRRVVYSKSCLCFFKNKEQLNCNPCLFSLQNQTIKESQHVTHWHLHLIWCIFSLPITIFVAWKMVSVFTTFRSSPRNEVQSVRNSWFQWRFTFLILFEGRRAEISLSLLVTANFLFLTVSRAGC